MEDQEFINQLAEKLSKLGTVRPLGFHYLHPYGTVPADSIICNGATYSRALYKDFFDYITTQGWVKTEAEWQEIATRDNGFCPFYSSGDGSTNFRTPKFAPYQQIAMGVAQTTTYHQAGLPNIEGSFGIRGIEPEYDYFKGSGCFFLDKNLPHTDPYSGHGEHSTSGGIGFSARAANEVYGNSDTVQPECHEWVMCVVAYGIATNVGSVDIQNVMSAVNAVQATVDSKLEASTVHITETWKSTDDVSWYRVWSDGWIEQGSKVYIDKYNSASDTPITFFKAYKKAAMGVLMTIDGGRGNAFAYADASSTTGTTIRQTGNGTNYVAYVNWYAYGY